MIHTDGKRTIANAEVSAAEGIIQRLEEESNMAWNEMVIYLETDLNLHPDYTEEVKHLVKRYAEAESKALCARRLQRAAKKGAE